MVISCKNYIRRDRWDRMLVICLDNGIRITGFPWTSGNQSSSFDSSSVADLPIAEACCHNIDTGMDSSHTSWWIDLDWLIVYFFFPIFYFILFYMFYPPSMDYQAWPLTRQRGTQGMYAPTTQASTFQLCLYWCFSPCLLSSPLPVLIWFGIATVFQTIRIEWTTGALYPVDRSSSPFRMADQINGRGVTRGANHTRPIEARLLVRC